MSIKNTRLAVTTTGADGAATGSATTPESIRGKIVRIDVDYAGTAPSSTDLTLAQAGESVASNILNLSNTATDAVIYPARLWQDNAGSNLTFGGPYIACGRLTATVAQSNALAPCVTLTIYWEI